MIDHHRICKLPSLAAIFPSVIVAAIHFRLSLLVGPCANVVFQHWFDTGERASGADAVIESLDRFISKPIPTVFLARHPVYPLPFAWWLATALNSVLWGLAIYACYRFAFRVLKPSDKAG